jgi:hypothetical protein
MQSHPPGILREEVSEQGITRGLAKRVSKRRRAQTCDGFHVRKRGPSFARPLYPPEDINYHYFANSGQINSRADGVGDENVECQRERLGKRRLGLGLALTGDSLGRGVHSGRQQIHICWLWRTDAVSHLGCKVCRNRSARNSCQSSTKSPLIWPEKFRS